MNPTDLILGLLLGAVSVVGVVLVDLLLRSLRHRVSSHRPTGQGDPTSGVLPRQQP